MDDSPSPPSQSLNSHSIESSSTQTLDRYLSFHRPKTDDHARARKLFDEIAQQPLESNHEEEGIALLKTNESIEGFEEPLLLSPLAIEDNVGLSSLAVDDSGNDVVDESEVWILENRSESEVDKPLISIASGSSSWYYDAYEKPSMVGAGLANLGNTCFLNAVLQCFTHTVLLVQGLYSYTHMMPCDCSRERFCLFCALWEHVELSLSSTGKIISPLKFVINLSYFSSSFRRFQQEDAHEFLQCFLDRLESSFSSLKTKDGAFSSQNDNLVKQVFGGRVVSKLRCCNCNHCSDTYEPSVDLSLEIEDANNLSTALESFTKVEHIEDEEMKFTCEHCKEKVSVEKQLMLDQTPPIYAFHLKRFKNEGSYVEKIDKHVEFPLQLDMQPYTCHNRANNVDLKYELYAVIVHAAFTSTCGHYYCYIRSSPDTWYKFDDSKVIKVSEAYVLSEEAYILFYARQGTPWFSNFMETYKLSFDPNSSNTSPKSVLDNVDRACTPSPDSSNNHSHNMNEKCKAEDSIVSESLCGSRDDRSEVTGAKDHHLAHFHTSVPLRPNYSSGIKASDVVKANSRTALIEYSFDRRLEVQKNVGGVTPTRHESLEVTDSRGDQNGVFTTPVFRPSNSSGRKTAFDIDKVSSPTTPPLSPGLDLSDDDVSEEVFALKPNQLKLLEKTSSKRQRNKDTDDPAKREALRQVRKMPGARGSLLMAALDARSKSEASMNKKRKKMSSTPRKKYTRSSDHFRHNRSSISRNLATSSFR